MSDIALILGAIFVLLLGNGFFSGSEIALISARKAALRKRADEGSRGAKLAEEMRDEPERFMAAVQIGVTVCGTLAGVCGGWLASRYIEPRLDELGLPGWAPVAIIASVLVSGLIVYFEMVVGELVPKALAIRFAAPIAAAVSYPVQFIAHLSRAPLAVITASTRLVLRLFGLKGPMREGQVSAEEIEHLVAEGRVQGVLSQSDASLLQGVFKFRDMPVRSVMIPRTKAFGLDLATEPKTAVRRIIEAGFSRVPIYEGTFDNPVGVLYVKDVLALLEKGELVDLRKVRLHPAHVVPDSKNVGDLLRELQKKRSHMALVINEHGSVVGIATLEDLVEEIVGEIRDEYDEGEERTIERTRTGALVVEGTVSNTLLRDSHAIPIPAEVEAESVGGFILERLGSVPKGGEVVEIEGYRLTVVDVERNRVAKVRIEKL